MPALYRGEIVIGWLVVTRTDQPWYIGSFEPSPDFYQVKPLFDEAIANFRSKGAFDRWETIWQEITAPGLQLVWENGRVSDNLLIHINGESARWRC